MGWPKTQEGRAEHIASVKKWREDNREKFRAYRREHYKRLMATNPEKRRAYARQYARKYRSENPGQAIAHRLRSLMRHVVLKQSATKTRVLSLIGCSIDELRKHLESQFQDGMSWTKDVHIDHIRPCASFDLSNPDQLAKCFHYSNLRPMWALDNKRKKDRYGLFYWGNPHPKTASQDGV